MDRKKRILWVGESSACCSTGFSKISLEILSRLYETGKYEIFEIASYCKTSDPRNMNVPWEVIGTIPESWDKNGQKEYGSSPYAQFGEKIFEEVCLKYKPDIFLDIRDAWMSSLWQLKSPFRKHMKYVLMATIDGYPQKQAWIDDYKRADLFLTYSRFGKEIIEREASGQIKVSGIVAPGANTDIFSRLNKSDCRKQLGIPEDANIILTVMRNQKRKLFPDLIDSFSKFMEKAIKTNQEGLIKNSYLWLHTSYPDVGYDLSKYIMNSGYSNRILITYMCENCKAFYPDRFQSEINLCRHCGMMALHPTSTSGGISDRHLAMIYNCADLYVQYSISEGFGMPIAEAKACEVPAIAVDHSAMSEQVETLGCSKIEVERLFHESVAETEQLRALPNNEDCARKILKFFNSDKSEREKWGYLARKDVIENFSMKRAAKVFEEAIDSLDVFDHSQTWENPKLNLCPNKKPRTDFRSSGELIDWCILNIIGRPDLLGGYWRNDLVKALNCGYIVGSEGRGGKDPFNPDKALKMFYNLANYNDMWERRRVQLLESVNKNEDIIKWDVA